MADIICIVDTAVVVPVNIYPIMNVDGLTINQAVVYNSAGMSLVWNFCTPAGATTGVAVTPTTGGDYDWTEHVSNVGMYSIEIPASGGASANNDTEGTGWFTGRTTADLPWRSPTIQFVSANVANSLMGTDRLQVDVVESSSVAAVGAHPIMGIVDRFSS